MAIHTDVLENKVFARNVNNISVKMWVRDDFKAISF